MLAAGGFADCEAMTPASLTYWRVRGGPVPGEAHGLETAEASAADLAEEALERLRKLIARFDDPDTAYVSQRLPKFADQAGEYDRLARRKEWARAGEPA